MAYRDFFKIDKTDGWRDAYEICNLVVDHYQQLGLPYNGKYCDIKIVKTRNCPYYESSSLRASNGFDERHMIELSIISYNYWCKLMYQLSHELTHCFIFCNNQSQAHKASWIEETICEAMSLYFLKLMINKWVRLNLRQRNQNYIKDVRSYLQDIIDDNDGAIKRNYRLTNCKDMSELLEIDKTSETQREDRKAVMIELYSHIRKEDVEGLIKYRDFVKTGEKILHTEKYRQAFPGNPAVAYLCDLQDNILNRDRRKERIDNTVA